jgi:GNAT superfamily N-acetyltransferase
MGVRLTPVTPDDDSAIDAYHSICAAGRAHDNPDFPPLTREHVAGEIRHPAPSREYHYFLIEDGGIEDGGPVGALLLSLPLEENLHLTMVELWVHPDHRRRGIGREAFEAIRQFARSRGRTTLLGEYCEPLESGPPRDPAPAAFAAAVGAERALPEVRRRLDLATVDTDDWRARHEDGLRQAKGYSVLWWSGAIPDEYAADIAYLDGRLVQDAPMGELRYEPEKVDAGRVRAMDEALELRGQSHYHAAARDDQTGRVVGWSALYFSVGVSSQAWQGITIVDPMHRGHGLGLVVKLENLLRTREIQPDLRYVDTWNATENGHMIAINEAIGFRPVDGWVTWQCEVDPAG